MSTHGDFLERIIRQRDEARSQLRQVTAERDELKKINKQLSHSVHRLHKEAGYMSTR